MAQVAKLRGTPTPGLHLDVRSPIGTPKAQPKILILRLTNIRRGKEGTATFKRRDGWCDYMDRTGRYSGRKDDVVATCGADRQEFTELVCAVKEAARRHNDAIVIRGVVVFPNSLSDQGCTNVLNAIVSGFESTGRKCTWALHHDKGKKEANKHGHFAAVARPVAKTGTTWNVGKGKFIPSPLAMKEYRVRIAALINAEMDREGLGLECPRVHPGRLRDIDDGRPAFKRLSPRAALRPDPDLTAAEDQFAIIWNSCIRQGKDPNKDSFIIEQRAALERRKKESQAAKAARDAEKAQRRATRIAQLPEIQARDRQIAELTAPLVPLSAAVIERVANIHRARGALLPPGWADTAESRAEALARYDAWHTHNAKKSEAVKKAFEQKRREKAAAAEISRRKQEQDAAASQELVRAAEAEWQRRLEDRIAAEKKRADDEALYRRRVIGATEFEEEIRKTGGVLRAAGTPQIYTEASGRVGYEGHAEAFLMRQSPQYLRWVSGETRKAKTAALNAAGGSDDEFYVCRNGLSCIERIAKERDINLTAPIAAPQGTPRAPLQRPVTSSGSQEQDRVRQRRASLMSLFARRQGQER